MKELLKFIWRRWRTISLRRNNIVIAPSVRFNNQTIFEKNTVVNKGSVLSGTSVGRNTYIGENSQLANCQIGRFCSIGSDVKIVSITHPSSGYISTSPSFYSIRMQNCQSFVDYSLFDERLSIEGRDVIIGNDVWIGSDAKILVDNMSLILSEFLIIGTDFSSCFAK